MEFHVNSSFLYVIAVVIGFAIGFVLMMVLDVVMG